MPAEPEMRRRGSRRRVLIVLLLVPTAAVIGLLTARQGRSPERLVQEARGALQERRYADAGRLARQALAIEPDSPGALLTAGLAAERLSEWREALGYYGRVGDDDRDAAAEARRRAGDVLLLQLHALSAAEREFRRVLELEPDDVRAHDRLAYLLGLAGQGWEMAPHQLALLRAGDVTRTRLYALSLGERLPTDPEMIRACGAAAPDDPLVLAGQAQLAVAEQRYAEAREMLERAVEFAPHATAIRLRLGRLYLDQGSDEDLVRWHAGLPDQAEEHPLTWVIRGLHAERTAQAEAAARCFWEALRRDPNQQEANYRLGQALFLLDRGEEAAAFRTRAQQLETYVQTVSVNALGGGTDSSSPAECEQAARLADELGLIWEAYGWRRLAAQVAGDAGGAPARADRLEVPTGPSAARCLPSSNPARSIDLSDYPLPVWDVGTGRSAVSSGGAEFPVTFVECAREVGAEFLYFDSSDERTGGKRIFESIGGGVAVLDYDQDGRPDLYATQRCAWPPGSDAQAPLDALFRNESGRQLRERAASAGILEAGYGQGATVGDYNSDGFPDLYVANIGANRFFVNNGDGTFSDATEVTGTAGDDWSTSCVLADLNGDGLPDLYVVNYLGGDDVFERVCTAPDGKGSVCPPGTFPAAPDRLYLNGGDGGFQDASAALEARAYGRGLGVVAADLDDSGRLSLFVANDQDPNFLYVPGGGEKGTELRLRDEALPRGVALSADGRAQACMGIAAGDATEDGRLDLFVTNFTEEPNALYVGGEDGLFVDAVQRAGLAVPSLPMLGFGTQFIDGELDGRLDLIVTNGHIDDRTRRGEQYRMPPQYFRNLGNGAFAEAPAVALGPYFSGTYLGRGLARWDWNADGREDIAISHLDAPLALLMNTTQAAGNAVSVELRGTRSARDPIGTRVTLRVGDSVLVRQLTAGDGFHASNERRLIFGLGIQDRVAEVRIRWPSGDEQHFANLESGGRYVVVEGEEPLMTGPLVGGP